MICKSTRRRFLLDSLGGMTAAAGLIHGFSGIPGAAAKDKIVVVEWGGIYFDTAKKVAAAQDKVDVAWELHTGGAAATLSKVKATWPKVQYDVLTGWDPTFISTIREGWAETYTAADVPNIKGVPESLIYKDDHGNWKSIPRTLSSMYWVYREDTCPVKISKIENLLDPKLKGQILFPDPGFNNNMAMVTLALGRGGNEHNMEPGWDFAKELAKSGNIGRVSRADNDVIASLTSGETSVAYTPLADAVTVGKSFPVKHLTKVDDAGLKTAIYTEGYTVLKGGNTRAAFEFVNFMLSPEITSEFNAGIGAIPTNPNAKVSSDLAFTAFTPDEMKQYAYIPDWGFISTQVDAWRKRWDEEIVPLL